MISAELVQALQPFGVPGLAIISVLSVAALFYGAWKARGRGRLPQVALAFIAGFSIIAILSVPFVLRPKTGWVRVNSTASWNGMDVSCTKSSVPIANKCGKDTVGMIATCWMNRPGGGVPSSHTFDECKSGDVVEWCAYKDPARVKVGTPSDTSVNAQLATVYVCGENVL